MKVWVVEFMHHVWLFSSKQKAEEFIKNNAGSLIANGTTMCRCCTETEEIEIDKP